MRGVIETWGDKLNLQSWDIRLSDEFDASHGEEAYVTRKDDERTAVIHVHPDAGDQAERLIVHELLHLVLSEVTDFAYTLSTSPSLMDLIRRKEELVINVLATALTDTRYTPVLPETRELLK